MKNQTTNQMTSVITIPQNVQDMIDELKGQNYHDEDMIAFIEEFGNDNFLAYYEEYVSNGEEYSYDAVDAFVDEFGIECVAYFTDAYYGQYDNEEEFAEQYTSDVYALNLNDTPVVVDWTATWNANLQYDFAFNDGYVFNKNF
jgi:N-methylhydantoinase B/oxoprolinase/acetone carboxylase alpha subunit